MHDTYIYYFCTLGCRINPFFLLIVKDYANIHLCCPGIADSCNFGCAEAACAPVYARCGAVIEDAGVLEASLLPVRRVGLPAGARPTAGSGRLGRPRLGKGFLARWGLGRECPDH